MTLRITAAALVLLPLTSLAGAASAASAPAPLAQTYATAAETVKALVDRRIDRDKIAAIRTALAYVDAQKAYYEIARRVEGTPFYDLRPVSSPGRHDGLYWVPNEGEDESPLAPLVAQAQKEGYPGAAPRLRGDHEPISAITSAS